MKRALGTGLLAGVIFIGFFAPTFILVFHGLSQQAEIASASADQSFSMPTNSTTTTSGKVASQNTVTIGGQSYTPLISATPTSRELGLSYRPNLPANTVMLFVFPQAGSEGIWMKGMNFPLDIFWLDSTGRVVYLEKNVSPATYPTIFAPPATSPALYVIEANTGTAEARGVSVGSMITLPSGLTAQ